MIKHWWPFYICICHNSSIWWTSYFQSQQYNRSAGLLVNSFLPRQNGRPFADDILTWIFLNEKFRILIQISLKFVPKDPIGNKSAMVQVMAWRRTGDKSLHESMLSHSLTHICGTRERWVNVHTDEYTFLQTNDIHTGVYESLYPCQHVFFQNTGFDKIIRKKCKKMFCDNWLNVKNNKCTAGKIYIIDIYMMNFKRYSWLEQH